MSYVLYQGVEVAQFKTYRECVEYVYERVLYYNENALDYQIVGSIRKENNE